MPRRPRRHIDWEVDEDMVMMFHALLEAAKHDLGEAIYETIATQEPGNEGSIAPIIAVDAPAFPTTREEVVEFSRRVNELVREFSDRAKEIRGDLEDRSDLRRLKFTYALRDRLPDEAVSST